MKRGSRFLIAFAAAVLTFASLVAFNGSPNTGNSKYNHCKAHHSGQASDTSQVQKGRR